MYLSEEIDEEFEAEEEAAIAIVNEEKTLLSEEIRFLFSEDDIDTHFN